MFSSTSGGSIHSRRYDQGIMQLSADACAAARVIAVSSFQLFFNASY